MKRVALIVAFLISALCSNAQETGNIVIAKVYESYTTMGKLKPSVRIFYPDNKMEIIDLPIADNRIYEQQDENDKKVREILDKICSKGYTLKTYTLTPIIGAGTLITTTYIFEKK